MIEAGKTAVITCMDDNFEKNLIADFLETLRNVAGYTGKVVVMDYGMTAAAVNTIKGRYGVTVAPCVRDRHIFSIRFRDAVKVIAALEDEITQVMLIDGGDVWFQAPLGELFQLCGNCLGCVPEHNSADPARNEWVRRILTHLSRDQARILARNFRGTPNKNAGMICGSRQAVATMAGLIEKYVNRCGVDLFGIDQIFFNFLVNRMAEGQKIMLPDRFNYVLLDHEDHLNISDHSVYDQERNLVNIVHNAGGGYYRVIKKECPARFNASQYQEVIKIQ